MYYKKTISAVLFFLYISVNQGNLVESIFKIAICLTFPYLTLVLCTGAGGPEPEPEFCPILPEPELEPEFVHLRQNSGSTYLCCKLLS